jgi:phospholipase/carboxylesterase
LLAVKSHGGTWDAIRGGFGTDVAALDAALAEVFDRFQVDGERVAIAGFSDGATCALSLGIINGDLFKEIIAFSPGFIISNARKPLGAPHIFISHGPGDRVLPMSQTSRQLVRSSGRRDTTLIIVNSMAAAPSHQPWRRLACSKCT